MQSNYLQRCLNQFSDLSNLRYERPFNLAAIEGEVNYLRQARKLTYRDLDPFLNKHHWWFERYWLLPQAGKVESVLGRTTCNFWQLSKGNEGTSKERQVIEELLRAFRSIELVSIILRFVRPESFGILSPPVERVLDVRRGSDAVETYLNYLTNLRAIRSHYDGLPRAADADMALWVLHEKCFTSDLKDPEVKTEYEQDSFMLRLRAANLVAPLVELPLVRLAQAFHTVRDDLAALVACYALESAVQERARLEGVSLSSQQGLDEIIDALHEKGAISTVERGKWKRLRDVRNNVFHAKVQVPSPREIKDLIQEVSDIDQRNKEVRLSRQKRQ